MSHESSDLTVQQIQQAVDAWIAQWEEGYFAPLSNLARLVEEVGELSRELNARHGDKPKKAGEPEGDVGMELGDILFVLVCIANSLDIDLSAELQRVLEKYDIRDAERWTKKS